jgi:hypothetical protein
VFVPLAHPPGDAEEVRQGLIGLRIVAESVPPVIDAKSFVGTVNPDFDGTEKGQPLHFGPTFTEGATTPAVPLRHTVLFGDAKNLIAHPKCGVIHPAA